MELSTKKARSILKEAKKDYGEEYSIVFEGDIPEDEGKMVEEAIEVVELAQQASEAGQDHPGIEKILELAGDATESQSGDDDSDEPFDGYDEMKNGKIIRELQTKDEDELKTTLAYERENKNRDTIIEAIEEIAEENSFDLSDDGGESGEDYKPWGKYDEEKPARIIAQITGMQTDDPEFFQNILDYEEANEDRASIKEVLNETIEEKKDNSEPESDGDEEGLTRQDIEAMDLEELRATLTYNDLDPEEIIGDADLNAARVKTASAFELEWPEDDDPEGDSSGGAAPEGDSSDESGEEGYGADYVWADLEGMDADDLKQVIKEKDLGMRITAKSDLDVVREKIAEKLEIEQPAPVPWRGYDKREMEKIVAKLPKLDDEELGAVYAYESENKNRKTIMKALEKIAEERGLTTGDGEDETDAKGGEEEGSEGAEDGADADAGSDADSEAGEPDEEGDDDATEPAEEAGTDGEYDHLISAVTEKHDNERLSIPAKLPKNVSTLPFDLTELSDKQLRQEYSAFLSYFGRAIYLHSLEKQLAIACKNIADDTFDEVLAELDESGKTATQLKAEAGSSKKVQKWRKRERKHSQVKEAMRSDAEIYKQNLDSISREWTMRSEEIDHSGGLGPRGKKARKG